MCKCGCGTCETKIRGPLLTEGKVKVKSLLSENLQYHVNKNIPSGKDHENGIKEDEGLMFRQFKFENFNPNLFSAGNLLFNNSTRVQRNEDGK